MQKNVVYVFLLKLSASSEDGKEDRHMGSIRSEETDELFRAILLLSDIEECYNFFEDICTIKEVLDISQRLQVAKKLKENKSYQEIS